MFNKSIILRPEDNGNEPPDGLEVASPFERLGILNPAVVQHGPLAYLLSRLYYSEKGINKSCIVKNTALLEGNSVRIVKDEKGRPIEELVLAPELPHGQRGVEDMRVGFLKGESPLHAFLVHYDGVDARTEYLRTKEAEPSNLLRWDRFGIYFPNITLQEAIELAPNEKYRNAWIKQDGKKKKLKILEEHYPEPVSPYLGTKDCALFPHKIKREIKGILTEQYAIITRLKPDMQIFFVNDFKELAKHEFWKKSIKDLEGHILLKREYDWEESHIGLSYSPFETSQGVIIPYHGATMKPERNYKFGAVLVDKDNPQKILGRDEKPILECTEQWECDGIVPGKVVFPTGHAVWDGYYHIFYGAGDKYIGHTTIPEQRLLDSFN